MIFRSLMAAVVSIALSGCGTFHSVALGDEATRGALQFAGSDCESIPRVYSGVHFDYCFTRVRVKTFREIVHLAQYLVFDGALSAAADTALLPYTLYRQRRDGSIYLIGR